MHNVGEVRRQLASVCERLETASAGCEALMIRFNEVGTIVGAVGTHELDEAARMITEAVTKTAGARQLGLLARDKITEYAGLF